MDFNVRLEKMLDNWVEISEDYGGTPHDAFNLCINDIDNLRRELKNTNSRHAVFPIACIYAGEKHQSQRRKGHSKEPYVNHCLRVGGLLAECGEDDPITWTVGVLHDVVEDTDATIEEISKLFGTEVATGVEWLTTPSGMTLEARKAYQARTVLLMPRREKLVKLSDQIDNLKSIVSDMPDWTNERCLAYVQGAADIASGCSGLNSLIDEKFNEAYEMAIYRIRQKSGIVTSIRS